MEHIPYPFRKYGELKITFDGKVISCKAEIADSIHAIHQALNYRTSEQFIDPLVLLFPDLKKSYSVCFNFPFSVEFIEVSNWCRYGFQPTQNYPGTFVKNYIGLKALILLPEGFFKRYDVDPKAMPFGPPKSTFIRPRVKCQLKKYGKYFPHGTQLL